ncbi:LysE/ArgO family amino acid transporter [Spongorhabdus nitratireducens]
MADLWLPFIKGFGINMGMIFAIGATNAFVLRQALAREHVFPAIAACALADTFLFILAGCGIGALIERHEGIKAAALWFGVLFLLSYSWRVWHERPDPQKLMNPDLEHQTTGLRTFGIGICLALINPQAIFEVIVLIGLLAAQYPLWERCGFTFGGIAASWVWFLLFGWGAYRMAPLLNNAKAWSYLNRGTALLMCSIAVSLVLQFG